MISPSDFAWWYEMRFLALLLMLALDDPSPETTIRDFYKVYVNSGLPNAAQLQKLSPYLSAPLQQALKQAAKQQAVCMKAHPDEKPPFIEGDLFTSNFEGLTSITNIRDAGNGAYDVYFQYIEKGHKFHWKDRLMLVKLPNGRWVIDDIQFRDNPPTLRHSLTQKGC
ncbi:hypothetical protein F183_A19700 [Bryobacterales bacterium F-183]|nr:hypothetical protein F183_A19700 [Bryobacterales bacterium F-183]